MKKANTVEYPKEGSPSQARQEKPIYIIPNLANELAKISQGNSERMLIENAEPTTPISNLMMQRQGSNSQVINALKSLNQLATQNKAKYGKILSTLKQRETPECRYEFSPQRQNLAAASHNNNQPQL